ISASARGLTFPTWKNMESLGFAFRDVIRSKGRNTSKEVEAGWSSSYRTENALKGAIVGFCYKVHLVHFGRNSAKDDIPSRVHGVYFEIKGAKVAKVEKKAFC